MEHLWPTASGKKELDEFERMRFSRPIVDHHLKELSYLGLRWYLVHDSIEETYRFKMDDYGFLDATSDDDMY